MFISHKYKAIFVHIQRTGGNSIQKIFEAHDPALIETIAPHPSHQRTKHCYIADIAAVVDPEILRDYTKFAVVRNPFDRMVSWYAHFQDGGNSEDQGIKVGGDSRTMRLYERGLAIVTARRPALVLAYRRAWARLFGALRPGSPEEVALRFEAIGAQVMHEVNRLAPTFDDFVRLPRDHPGGAFARLHTDQIDYLSADPGSPSALLVDHVLRFESLPADFAALADRLGFPGRLPHVNASRRSPHHYRDSYTPTTRDAVARRFARDCEQFGYAF